MKRALGWILAIALLIPMMQGVAPAAAETPLVLGDVLGDGAVGTDDALVVLQASTYKLLLTEEERLLADVDGDGVVNSLDALLLMQYTLKSIDCLPGADDFEQEHPTTPDPIDPSDPSMPAVDKDYEPVYTTVEEVRMEAEDGYYPDSCILINHGDIVSIGHTNEGNEYQYFVTLPTEGYYLLTYQASTVTDPVLTLAVDGLDRITLRPENAGDWNDYRINYSTQPLYLPSGTHSLIFRQDKNLFNFDWFSLVYLAEGSPDQIPEGHDVSTDFINSVAQVGYRLPLSVDGLQKNDRVERYVWRLKDEFVATEDLMAPTQLTIMEMENVAVWPIVRIGNKTYYTFAETEFALPVSDPLPVITINTENDEAVTSKDEYLNATMSIEAEDVPADQLYNGVLEIKGRGNATWGYPKKPYRLKLDKKADLFGMGSNKHWVLLANYRDRAFSRTKLAFDLAEHLGVDTPAALYVNVVMNGEDVGVYMLCEQIRVGKTRVDIMDWEDEVEDETDLSSITSANGYDTTGGFLLELNGYYDEVSKFTTAKGVQMTVKSPEYLNTSSELFNNAVMYIQDFEDAVYSSNFINSKGQHYSDIFDVEDLVNYWLINEFVGNLDSGRWSSTYMYKDIGGDKFHMGPVWDFDSSIGNYHGHHTQCPATTWVAGKQGKWYTQLYRDRTFVQKLYDRYWENREYIGNMVTQAKDLYLELYTASIADHEKWDIPTTYQYDGEVVVQWLKDRIVFFDTQFASVDTLYASLNK